MIYISNNNVLNKINALPLKHKWDVCKQIYLKKININNNLLNTTLTIWIFFYT